jgi:hypothetical protein
MKVSTMQITNGTIYSTFALTSRMERMGLWYYDNMTATNHLPTQSTQIKGNEPEAFLSNINALDDEAPTYINEHLL